MNSFEDFLQINQDDFHGLIEDLNHQNDNPESFRFFYINFQNGKPRTINFIECLLDNIVSYCLTRKKTKEIEPREIRSRYLEAKRKFTKPQNNKTGEPGELISYFFIDGYLKAPKIFTKMSLKTNPQMHFHGSDGVHLKNHGNKLNLYFGESKLYKTWKDAIRDATESVRAYNNPISDHTNQTGQEFEIVLLSDEIDLPDGEFKELILKAFNPYSKERGDLSYSHVCLIGFDFEELLNEIDTDNFQNVYKAQANECYKYTHDKITNDEELNKINWIFFFLPFDSVENFRKEFLQRLNE